LSAGVRTRFWKGMFWLGMKFGSSRKYSTSPRTMLFSGLLKKLTAPPKTDVSPWTVAVMSWVGPVPPGWTMGARVRSSGRNTGIGFSAIVR